MDKQTKRIIVGAARCLTCMLVGAAVALPFVPAKERIVYETQVVYCTVESAEPTAPLNEEDYKPKMEDLGEFKLTAYCTCDECCGDWADGITFTGTVATPGRTIAVDPSVIPLGSVVQINGVNYIAEDIGGAIKGNRIDMLFPSHQEALEFGIQYSNVSILNERILQP